MKKLLLMMALCASTLFAHAQFEQGKLYAGASLTGLDLNYKGADGMNLGFDAKLGYLFADNLMALSQLSYQHDGNDAVADHFSWSVGARYYIIQNGLFLGLNAKLVHANHNYNDVMPGFEVGYAFFISGKCTIEPSVYYGQSFRRHSDFSTIGLRIGFGYYF